MGRATDKQRNTTKKNKTLPLLILAIGLVFIALAWIGSHPAVLNSLFAKNTQQPTPAIAQADDSASTSQSHLTQTPDDHNHTAAPAQAEKTDTTAAPEVIDHTSPEKVAPKPQIEAVGNTIGDPKAPIHIIEYASLTCGHCANFHENTLDALRVKYIDTGKVYLEFREFPLNRPALDATMILNCLPKDQYFGFMSMLFQTQEHWAFTEDYLVPLRQNARLAGMSNEAFDACLADKAKQDALLKDMQDASKKYDINATPTFVINDGAKKIIGGQTVAAFSEVIDPLLAQKDQQPAAPQSDVPSETTPNAPTAPATQGQ